MSFLSTVAGILGEAIYVQGRYDEALRFTHISEDAAGAEDVHSQVLWRSVRAKCLARQGKTIESLGLAGESVTLAESTDALNLRWHALMSQADVLQVAGRMAEAETVLPAGDPRRRAEAEPCRRATQP
jgi:ATP/maltotriose-dependent transcriptional regulator MalT